MLLKKNVEARLSKITQQLDEATMDNQELRAKNTVQAELLQAAEKQKEDLILKEQQSRDQEHLIAALKVELSQKEDDVKTRERIVGEKEQEFAGKEKSLQERERLAREALDLGKAKETEFSREKERLTNEVGAMQEEYKRRREEVDAKETKLIGQQKEMDRKNTEIKIELEKLKLKKELHEGVKLDNIDERAQELKQKEVETRIKELELLKRQNNLDWSEAELARKVGEVNVLLKAVTTKLDAGKRLPYIDS